MVLRSMAVMSLLNVAKAAAALLISVLIAAKVPPAEFGLVAFAIPLMALLTLLTDLGLSSAIVRHESLDPARSGAAVTLLALAGAVSAVLIGVAAEPLEAGTGMKGLQAVLIGFAGTTACAIWSTAPRALLERQLRYGSIAGVEAVALLAGLAAFGIRLGTQPDVMALVLFHLTLQASRAVTFTALARPLFVVDWHWWANIDLIKVGGWVLANNLLSYAARNADRMMIGPVLGATALGLYGLAYQFMTIPLVLLSWPASGILLSALSRLRGQPAAQKAVTQAVLTGTVTLSLPLMAYMLSLAAFALNHFYAGRWQGLDRLVWMLAPVGMVQSLAVYGSAVLVESGRLRLNLALGLLNGIATTCTFALTVRHGIEALTAAYAVVAIVVSLTMIVALCKEASIGARDFARCLLPGFWAALTGAGAGTVVFQAAGADLWAWLWANAAFVTAAALAMVPQKRRLVETALALRRTKSTSPA